MKAMNECSRYKFCSVNVCPLDNEVHLRNKLSGETKCDMAKSIRFRIGSKHGLLKKGLTNAEFSAFLKWEGRSETEKVEARNRMYEIRAKAIRQNPL